MYLNFFSVASDKFHYFTVSLKTIFWQFHNGCSKSSTGCIRYEEYLESIVKRSVGLKEEDDSDLLLGIHFQVFHQGLATLDLIVQKNNKIHFIVNYFGHPKTALLVPKQRSPKITLHSACKKVLNSGLGPFKDQTAEMVLFLHKSPFFPIMIIMLCNPVPGTKEAAC